MFGKNATQAIDEARAEGVRSGTGAPVTTLPDGRRKNLVVTIGRQYGSGGREIGENLARLLGVAYYDKKLVLEAAEKSGFSTEAFVKQNESVPRGLAWLFSYSSKGFMNSGGIPLDDQLFIAQANAIKDIARAGNCVIVGRCADYVLDDMHDELNIVDVFVRSTEEARLERIARRNDLTPEGARERLKQIAPRRANYYERYTGRKWGDLNHFDVVMNTAWLEPAAAAQVLVEYLVARGYITRDELPLDPNEPRPHE